MGLRGHACSLQPSNLGTMLAKLDRAPTLELEPRALGSVCDRRFAHPSTLGLRMNSKLREEFESIVREVSTSRFQEYASSETLLALQLGFSQIILPNRLQRHGIIFIKNDSSPGVYRRILLHSS